MDYDIKSVRLRLSRRSRSEECSGPIRWRHVHRMAIDALVIATAVRFGGGMVATHDPTDRPLAAGYPNVAVVEI
jgi:hypothetical protein